VIVLGVVLEIGRQVEYLHPERGHAEPGANPLHCTTVGSVELIQMLDGDVSHSSSSSHCNLLRDTLRANPIGTPVSSRPDERAYR
jgi:hypothetical protein